MERSEAHIEDFLSVLGAVWKKHPKLRFGQLVVNVLGKDPFYIEDDKATECFARYSKTPLVMKNPLSATKNSQEKKKDCYD